MSRLDTAKAVINLFASEVETMCSKKDYIRAAKLVQDIHAGRVSDIATATEDSSKGTGAYVAREAFVRFFRGEDARFDVIRFRAACEPE
jgi:hypothetical protein